jgi:hypothetical protein
MPIIDRSILQGRKRKEKKEEEVLRRTNSHKLSNVSFKKPSQKLLIRKIDDGLICVLYMLFFV